MTQPLPQPDADPSVDALYLDIRQQVEQARAQVVKPEHKGQVELYLKWLAKHEEQPGENAPKGSNLCSDEDAEVVELMDLEKDQIHVAEYWLQLPPQEVLQAKLHTGVVEAKARLEFQNVGSTNE